MNKKLYVGNMAYTTTDEELRSLFEQVGPVVSAVVIMDRATGRSKGFGFVEMETAEGAQEAIEKLNNYNFKARSITVSEARPQGDRPAGGGGGGRFGDRPGGGRPGGRPGGGGGRGGFNRGGGDRQSY